MMRLAARVVGVQACRLATGCVTSCGPIVVPLWCDVPAVQGRSGCVLRRFARHAPRKLRLGLQILAREIT